MVQHHDSVPSLNCTAISIDSPHMHRDGANYLNLLFSNRFQTVALRFIIFYSEWLPSSGCSSWITHACFTKQTPTIDLWYLALWLWCMPLTCALCGDGKHRLKANTCYNLLWVAYGLWHKHQRHWKCMCKHWRVLLWLSELPIQKATLPKVFQGR